MARILFADDDAATRDVICRALQLDGHSVTTADDGADAAAKLASGASFDIVVTDIQMPGIDGISLARSVLASNPGMQVVLISAHADVLDQARSLAPGSVQLLAKPFTIDQMRGIVRAALRL